MSPADGGGAIAAPIPGGALRRREPIERRTGDPVRRKSFIRGGCEQLIWGAFDRKKIPDVMLAAERYERVERLRGKRRGPLGHVGLEVLRELLRIMDFKTGRLEPAITLLMQRLKRSKDAVVRALAALKRAGLLTWIRRYVETGERGPRGPRVKQTSNAYAVLLPPRIMRLLGRRHEDVPVPDDHAQARDEAAEARRRHQLEDPHDPLGSALGRLGSRFTDRESAKRGESRPSQDSVAPEGA